MRLNPHKPAPKYALNYKSQLVAIVSGLECQLQSQIQKSIEDKVYQFPKTRDTDD